MQARFFLLVLLLLSAIWGQAQPFSHADSLRGALRAERTCYDVTFYDLEVKVDIEKQFIAGFNDIHFTAVHHFRVLQFDLFDNMSIDGVTYEGKSLAFRRESNAVFVDFPAEVQVGHHGVLHIRFSGVPIAASRPPWDGGFVWKKDGNGQPWVGVACEGTGASLWWPNKDHLSDEPDSMRISIVAPHGLMAVANGQQRSVKDLDANWTKTEWFVSYPINNYNVTVNIADYVHWNEKYSNASGIHDLDYYVLRENEQKAHKQFAQVPPMLKCFEKYFGEYPFWKDGYALVETSYLGMEHQGAIAYGNHYRPGYNGYDPLKLGWDYIIIHESGHEWWGNSVSCRDHAELWIHEGFCTYSEAVYVEELWDLKTSIRYLRSQRGNIANRSPIVGPLNVNYDNWNGSDMYYKGSWMLHTLRFAVADDVLWWKTLKTFAETFKHKNTNTQEIIAWWNKKLGQDYTWLWREYLYHAAAPTLLYKLKKKGEKTQIKCRWLAGEPNFALPIPILTSTGESSMIQPTTSWQKFTLPVPIDQFKFDRRTWYGKTRNLKKK